MQEGDMGPVIQRAPGSVCTQSRPARQASDPARSTLVALVYGGMKFLSDVSFS